MIEIGHKYGLHCIVDAAAERPDVPNIYLEMGADAVVYSGGKCLRGPQSTGLVLGKKELLDVSYMNSAPHYGVGRTMKVTKEGIMGLLAAVEAWVYHRDHSREWDMWKQDLNLVRESVQGIPSVIINDRQPGVENVAPSLYIAWDPDVLGTTVLQMQAELLAGEQPIAVDLADNGIVIMPYMMEKGEAEVVSQRLVQLLTAKRKKCSMEPKITADICGAWRFDVNFVLESKQHSCFSPRYLTMFFSKYMTI